MGDYSASARCFLQAADRQHRLPRRLRVRCLPAHAGPRAGAAGHPGTAIRATYQVPVLFNNCLTEILARQDDYWSGKITESEFRHLIGSPNNDCPLPNIKMIIFENNYGNNHSNVNKRFAGMANTEFNWDSSGT